MQPDYYDYSIEDIGCCLNCGDAKEGCLCYNCRCRRCFHYTSPEENDGEKGVCDIANDAKEIAKRKNKIHPFPYDLKHSYYDIPSITIKSKDLKPDDLK